MVILEPSAAMRTFGGKGLIEHMLHATVWFLGVPGRNQSAVVPPYMRSSTLHGGLAVSHVKSELASRSREPVKCYPLSCLGGSIYEQDSSVDYLDAMHL